MMQVYKEAEDYEFSTDKTKNTIEAYNEAKPSSFPALLKLIEDNRDRMTKAQYRYWDKRMSNVRKAQGNSNFSYRERPKP